MNFCILVKMSQIDPVLIFCIVYKIKRLLVDPLPVGGAADGSGTFEGGALPRNRASCGRRVSQQLRLSFQSHINLGIFVACSILTVFLAPHIYCMYFTVEGRRLYE